MNNWATRLIGWLAGLGAILAMFFRGQALKEKAERAEERADQAEAATNTYQRINSARTKLKQQQQNEAQDDDEAFKTGDRDHFDNNWR